MLIDRDRSFLLLVDVQERLLPAMADPAPMLRNAAILLQAAARLAVPVLASEQYPQGLGHTVGELASLLPPGAVTEKLAFSCLGESALRGRIAALGRTQAVLCGIESHVCVLQTAFDLAAGGYQTFVARDATTSRHPLSVEAALARFQKAGIDVVTTEMVVFEWLARAGTPEFREISKLIR
jgi:nicotinamidase-related amidase